MGETVYLKDYKAPDYWVREVDLSFDIHDGETFVTSKLQVERNGDHARPLKLNGEKLELLGVKLNDQELAPEGYVADKEFLTLQPPADEAFTLETRVRIHPEDNTDLEGLYKSGSGYCTQCEAEGFRKITYFVDRPDNMATYTVRIEADKNAPILLSNGNPIEQGEAEDGRHYAVWHDPFPKPSYLFALVASDLACLEDTYETMSGRKVALRIFAEPKHLPKLEFGMQALKAAMKWDEDVNGWEYDLDQFSIVAVDDFNFGAMENKSLNVFNTSAILAHKDTQSDADYAYIWRVVAHEFFHNITGDRITLRDWCHLTLKEGLTVYRDQEFSSDTGSRALQRIQDVKALRGAQFSEDKGPLAHPIRPDHYQEINNFYTSTVYNKGAEVIRMMLSAMMTRDERRAMTDLYFSRHDGQAITTEDFVKCVEDSSGMDLSQFQLWYSQAGTPKINAAWTHAKDGKFTLTLNQTVPPTPGQPDKLPMHMPVAFGLVGADGKDVPLDASGATTRTLELTEAEQSFTFDAIPEGAVPSILRGFSAPVIVEAPYTDGQLRHLMAYDSDSFNQWDAGQKFVMTKMLEQVDRVEAGHRPKVDPEVIDVYRTILERPDLDSQFRALMLGLPTGLSQRREKIDPDAIRKVYDAFSKAVAVNLSGQLWRTYERTQPEGPHAYNLEQVGRRALKNRVLGYLDSLDTAEVAHTAYQQFKAADNMTDREAAFDSLCTISVCKGLRDKAVHDFYEMYKDEPLAINTWLNVRASARSDSLETARKLEKHPAFDPANPNQARALYGGFASSDAFHAKDGSGYDFLADFIIRIDPVNSHTSARMIGMFADFRRYAKPWQTLMAEALHRIAETPGLSKGVTEKLERYGILKPETKVEAPALKTA